MPKTRFLAVIEEIIEAAPGRELFHQRADFELNVVCPGWMDLTIDGGSADTGERGNLFIAVAHYKKRDGDVIPCPWVVINEAGVVFAIELGPRRGRYTRVRNERTGRRRVSKREESAIQRFLDRWAERLVVRGYVEAAKAARSLPVPILPANILFEGGDGSSRKKAIVIRGTGNFNAVTAQYLYARQHFSHPQVLQQELMVKAGRSYDRLLFDTDQGQRVLWFDITE